MIVHYLNFNRVAFNPAEADPPLVADPNTVLSSPITGQCLQPISGNHSQIGNGCRVPLEAVETALLLACLRRRTRPTDVPPLPRVRSLAYFQPIIDELREHPAPGGYLPYLRLKLRGILDNPGPAKVQKSTFSDDR
jgi:hypothetical protein